MNDLNLLKDIPKEFLKNYKPAENIETLNINNKKSESNNNMFDNIWIFLILVIIFDIV